MTFLECIDYIRVQPAFRKRRLSYTH